MQRLVLIDGHAILHRAYHAYPLTLKTRKGELTNAVYGFSSILLTVLRQLHPEYVAVAFDLPKPTFRHKEFKAYKAHRPKVDKELIDQIPRAHEVVETLNIPIFEKEGYEGDDVIGSLACKAKLPNIKNQKLNIKNKNQKLKIDKVQKQLEVIIVTGDKDALQLIDKNIKVFVPGRGKQPAKMFDQKEFIDKYCFEPKKLVDFKALAGDASDGIPGVNGIGPKTATKLICRFKDLKGIYEHLNQIEVKSRGKLKEYKKRAFLSYRLAEIFTKVPLKLNLKKCRLLDYDREKVKKLFEELEFKSLIKRLPGMENESDRREATLRTLKLTEKSENKNKQMGLF